LGSTVEHQRRDAIAMGGSWMDYRLVSHDEYAWSCER
jgi:hypothetical protein